MNTSLHLPIAVTMGEPAGIGTEIALKSWAVATSEGLPFFLIDDVARVRSVANMLNIDTRVIQVSNPQEALERFAEALPVIDAPLSAPVTFGSPSPDTAPNVISSMEQAVGFCMAGSAAAVVTNPIQKSVLYDAGFRFPGHTEFLADLGGDPTPPVMMLACEGLRVVPVSVHLGLRDAISSLSTELIVDQTRTTARALVQDFGMECPRLAIAGLNPHAGEKGAMGREEQEIIVPAIDILAGEGVDVRGPMPPDTMFAAHARRKYDAAICMYHDQALIPVKTLDFEHGVNITLGLPFVRTSPDHGTALEIAGGGQASPASLVSALKTAKEMALHRAANSG